MIKFNVYEDPWIEADYEDSGNRVVSMRQCFEDAHRITDIRIPGPVFEIGNVEAFFLMRTILSAAYRFEDISDKKEVFQYDRNFDMEKIDGYIHGCGDVFNLFDAEKPFLQTPKSEWVPDKTDEKSVGFVYPVYPSGNNGTFHIIRPESESGDDVPVEKRYSLTAPQYIGALLYMHNYRGASGKGYTGCGAASKGAPLYAVPKGKNLFETLLLSAPVQDPRMKHDAPMWEWDEYAPDIAEMTAGRSFGPCASVFYPVTHVVYGKAEEHGGEIRVRSVYGNALKWRGENNPEGRVKPGEEKELFWEHEPDILSYIKKSGNSAAHGIFAYNPETDPWMEVLSGAGSGCIQGFLPEKTQEIILDLQTGKRMQDPVPFLVAGMVVNKKDGLIKNSQGKWEWEIPARLLRDKVFYDSVSKLCQAIWKTTGSNKCLRELLADAVSALEQEMHKGDAPSEDAVPQYSRHLIGQFLELEKDRVMKWILDEKQQESMSDEDLFRQAIKDALHIYDSVNVPDRFLIAKERHKKDILAAYSKLRKREKGKEERKSEIYAE